MQNSRVVLGALAFLAAGTAGAFAQSVTTATDLNLRAGPGPEYPVITVMPPNSSVTLYGCITDRTWCDLQYQDRRGWAYSAYLSYDMAPSAPMYVPSLPPTAPIPTVTFDQTYWAQYYAQETFYPERDRLFNGAAAGAGTGAIIGALLGGPIGAAIGAGIGAGVGGAADAAINPPEPVRVYVTQQTANPVLLSGEVVVGAQVPDVVTLSPVPDYNYQSAYINGQWVLVDPQTRAIVYVFR